MKTVKAKIKGTNAILEGCVCDDSFFVSVDHDTFERYDLDEVELCESNPNSLTLEEAAEEYSKRVSDGHNYRDLICGFIAGAEWQAEKCDEETSKLLYAERQTAYINGWDDHKGQMLKDAVEGEAEELYNDGESQCTVSVGTYFKPGDKVYILKAEEE